jgi:hypothetical protein
MIVLDSDLLVIDLRYPADARYLVNGKVLDALHLSTEELAITCQTLLEVIGVVSFNSTSSWTSNLPERIPIWYAVTVIPDPKTHPVHANCAVQSLIDIMAQRCALEDAVVLEQIKQFAPHCKLFLTWNARHFRGKLSIPVQTPEEWWQRNQPAAP